jgi:ketosteroid isomerase-like protein
VSAENVELARAAFEPWRAGRLDDFARFVADEIEWDISGHPLPDFPDTGRGRDAFLRHMAEYAGGWVDYRATEVELTAHGDDVLAVTHESARMRETDVKLDRHIAIVWTVQGGRFTRFRVYKTREDALAALGS